MTNFAYLYICVCVCDMYVLRFEVESMWVQHHLALAMPSTTYYTQWHCLHVMIEKKAVLSINMVEMAHCNIVIHCT